MESDFGVGMLVFTLRASSLPSKPTFPMFRVIRLSLKSVFPNDATKCQKMLKRRQIDTQKTKVKSQMESY